MESVKACQDLQWRQDTNALHLSETNGIADKVVRRVHEETPTTVQSGFPDEWWGCAMERYRHLRKKS